MFDGVYIDSFVEVFELLFNKIPVLKITQLSKYMEKYYGVGRQDAAKIINVFSSEGLLLVTSNGYVTTREGVRRVSLKEPIIRYKSHLVLEERLLISRETEDILDAFWVLLNHIPLVTQFVFTEPPILLTFIDENKNKIIEVVKFRKGQELLINQYLKKHYSYDKESREITERYAIVEDPKVANIIGAYGFTKFFTIEKHEKHNTDVLIELALNRDSSIAWRDAEKYEEAIGTGARASYVNRLSEK